MTEFADYPMALYPPKGEMLIVNNEQEHAAALDAHWPELPPPAEPPAVVAVASEASIALVLAEGGPFPVFGAPEADEDADEESDSPETFDDAGAPVKRGPGRPKKVIP